MDETTTRNEGTETSASFVERLAEKIGLHGRASLVFGDPITYEGVTVVPVAKARWGFGGGAGTGSGKDGEGEGSGGGGGLVVSPVGYIELTGGAANFRRVYDVNNVGPTVLAGALAFVLVLGALRRLFR
jgi:uncharacterized spore protein YtfJ